jgi:DNA-binding LacI/PurR family transcriptional regulator
MIVGADPMTRDQARAPRLGLLVDLFEYTYQSTLVHAVMDTARRHGAGVRAFVGGGLRSPERFGAERNFLYDLVGPASIDGLIVLSSTLANYADHSALIDFAGRFRPLPMASIGMLLEGVPSVAVDNAHALREGIRHLVRVHGHRRIAFVRGPAGNQDAEERYRVYREVLAEHEIPFDAALIAPGDFTLPAGTAAVRTLIDERRASFQALVAANDYMALGAVEALRARGVRVPADAAVMGFDDLDEARFAHTPLTSVRQPLREQAELAAEMVLAQLRGDGVPARTLLPAQLVVRRSCGCRQAVMKEHDHSIAAPVTDWTLALEHAAAWIFLSLKRVGRPGDAERCAAVLAAALDAEAGGQHGVFGARFEEILAGATSRTELETWHEIVKGMRDLLRPALASDAARALRAEDAWHEAHVLVAQATERALARRSLAVTRWARTVSEVSDALAAAPDVPALMAALVEQLPRLQIPSAQVALFEARRPESGARLVLSVRGGVVAPPSDALYPAARLLPEGTLPLDQRQDLIVLPLFARDEPLGIAVLELGPREPTIYEMLRDRLSSTLAALTFSSPRDAGRG